MSKRFYEPFRPGVRCGSMWVNPGRWLAAWKIPAVLMATFLVGCGAGLSSTGQDPDPVVAQFPLVYIERDVFVDAEGRRLAEDVRRPDRFRAGGRLYIKDRAAAGAPARDLTSGLFSDPAYLSSDGQLYYDVKDLAVSPDGKQLLFAMRAPDIDRSDDRLPAWDIWRYTPAEDRLERVIQSDSRARAGDDVAPEWLADGRIVFSSNRQAGARAILLDEGKPQFSHLAEDLEQRAFVLHTMSADGTDIRQISFNQSHDLDPRLLSDGRIVFSRWDNMGPNSEINLYTIRPDGTGLELLYGAHSHDVPESDLDAFPEEAVLGENMSAGQRQFLAPLELPDGELLVLTRSFLTSQYNTLPLRIDVRNHVDRDRAIDGSERLAESRLIDNREMEAYPQTAGQYGSIEPFFDNTSRYLATWSPCRLKFINPPLDDAGKVKVEYFPCLPDYLDDPAFELADPLYGLWIHDPDSGNQVPIQIPREGLMIDEAVLMTPRQRAEFLPEEIPQGDLEALAAAGYGQLDIRSVYDLDGTDATGLGLDVIADPLQVDPAQRPAQFLRLVKAASIPPSVVKPVGAFAYGFSTEQLMREITGYIPIAPDGSVRAAIPADVPLAISIVDSSGARISPRHNTWLQVRPGGVLQCNGCHDPAGAASHGRSDADAPALNVGAESEQPFRNTDPALLPRAGETMAQTRSRIRGLPRPTAEMLAVDEWTDPDRRAPAADLRLDYAQLSTEAPVSAACLAEWTARCRIVINYPDHIEPLWSVDRRVQDSTGNFVPERDQTCIRCHSDRKADGSAMVPAAQLDLSGPQPVEIPKHLRAYHELLYPDNSQQLVNGVLQDILIDAGATGVDQNGNPVNVLSPLVISPPMSTAGALASDAFFAPFREGGSHEGWMTDSELRLLREWLDIGAQYFNNPFFLR